MYVEEIVQAGFLRALVVDNDAGVRREIGALLGAANIDCVQAVDGIDALKFASDHAFDLIVTAIRMPRMGGIELLGIIERGAFGERPPPVIVCSGQFGEIDHDTLCGLKSRTTLVTKPIDVTRFAAAVQRALPAA